MKRLLCLIFALVVLSITSFGINVSANDFSTDTSFVEEAETSAFDKFFQIASLGIMTVGVIGIPVYIALAIKKKRQDDVVEEQDDGEGIDPLDENNIDAKE